MQIIRGATPNAPKFIIYGLSGVGKTSLAGKLKNALIIDIEGGVNFYDTPRTPQIKKLDVFYQYLVELYQQAKADKREFDYLVIDTADWLVRMIIEEAAGIDKDHLNETLNKSNGGYGNGKQVLENHIRKKLLPILVSLNTMGYGICLLAHADKKDLMNSEGANIEQIAPKIEPNTMNVFVEWVDAVYYLKKDIAGDRVLVADSDGNALAKNRTGITGEFDIEKYDINDIILGKVKAKKGDK